MGRATAAGPGGQVTIVVITRDRREAVLASLPRHEAAVIVVDNGSRDGTVAAIRRLFPQVQVVPLSRDLGAAARNVGVRLARTPFVAFADDDSWWQPGALDRALDHLLVDPRIGLLAARVMVGGRPALDPLSALMAQAPLGRTGPRALPRVLDFRACASVVRRSAFLEVGGFDPVVRRLGEEQRVAIDLATAGWSLGYADDVVVRHLRTTRPVPDPGRRRRLAARNSLLTAVMRRPWRVVAAKALNDVAADADRRAGALAALPRLPRALAQRQRIPVAVEVQLRMLALSAVSSTCTAGSAYASASGARAGATAGTPASLSIVRLPPAVTVGRQRADGP